MGSLEAPTPRTLAASGEGEGERCELSVVDEQPDDFLLSENEFLQLLEKAASLNSNKLTTIKYVADKPYVALVHYSVYKGFVAYYTKLSKR
eukprot:5895075-Amphidinium_carterae.1